MWSVKPDGTDNRHEFTDTLFTCGSLFFDWSPDGGSIVRNRYYPEEGYAELMVRDLATGKERQLTFDRQLYGDLLWLTNGIILFVSPKSGQSNLWMMPASGGEAVPVTQGSPPIVWASISSDDKTLVSLQYEQIDHVWISNIDGSNLRQVTWEDFRTTAARFSPDGSHIAAVLSGADLLRPEPQLFVMDRDGKNRRQLTFGSEPVLGCDWSPDGKWLAYRSRLPGEPLDSAGVFLIQPINPGPPRLLCKTGFYTWVDSQRIAVSRGMQTLFYSVKGGLPTRFYQDSIYAVPTQNTARLLAYDFRKGREGWWLLTADMAGKARGEARRLLFPSANYLTHLPEADFATPIGRRFILYAKQGGELWRVWTSTGKEERIGKALDRLAMLDVSMDGKEILWWREETRTKLALVKNLFE